jgi:UDP-2-acetamido-2-deoxy-ribo-hexuluronate aminotransferase
LEAAITTRTKAIIPVSLYGQMPDMERINSIAARYNIAVIEDAAQSFGAMRNGRKSCGSSVIGSTSFFPSKPLGCFGDGGALFTNDDTLAYNMRAIRTHGGVKRHHHTHIGMNGRLDTLQAAIILGKWEGFPGELEARAKIGARYSELLKEYVIIPHIAEGNTHLYAQYTIRVDEERREEIGNALKSKDIPTAIYYPKCFHEQPVFEYLGYKYGDFPESEKSSRTVLSLPMHGFLMEDEQDKIIEAIINII